MKKILSAISVLFCTMIFMTGCSDNRQAIATVLDKDATTGSVDNSSLDNYCSSLRIKCQNMKNIDLSGCPPDFQRAYIAHTSAWSQKLAVAYEVKSFNERYNSFSGFCEAFLRGLVFDTGMTAEAARDRQAILDHEYNAKQAVSSTWDEVLRIAAEYDVDVSKYK